MDTKITLTPEEMREILLARIERSLTQNGVTLSATVKARILGVLELPDDALTAAETLTAPGGTKGVSKAVLERLRGQLRGSDKRARVYGGTAKARSVDDPRSTREKVLNYILKSELCTLDELIKGTKRPRKAIYTALWTLGNEGLISKRPLFELFE